MAYVQGYNPLDDTQEVTGFTESQGSTRLSTPTLSSGATSISGAGDISSVPAAGMPSPTANRQNLSNTSFSNIQNYLKANSTAGANVGNVLAGSIGQTVDRAQQAATTAQEAFGGKVAAGTNIYNIDTANPQISSYTGPSTYYGSEEDIASQTALGRAQEQRELAKTQAGQSYLLGKAYNAPGTTTPTSIGSINLGQYLMSKSAPAQTAVQGALGRVGPAGEAYSQQQQAMNQLIGQRQGDVMTRNYGLIQAQAQEAAAKVAAETAAANKARADALAATNATNAEYQQQLIDLIARANNLPTGTGTTGTGIPGTGTGTGTTGTGTGTTGTGTGTGTVPGEAPGNDGASTPTGTGINAAGGPTVGPTINQMTSILGALAAPSVVSIAKAISAINDINTANALSQQAQMDTSVANNGSMNTPGSQATPGPTGTGGVAADAGAAAAAAATAAGASPAAAGAAAQAAADAARAGATPAGAAAAGEAAANSVDANTVDTSPAADVDAAIGAIASAPAATAPAATAPADTTGTDASTVDTSAAADMDAALGAAATADADGGGGGGDKIICTAMNDYYKLPYRENQVWIRYSKLHLKPEHQVGYHKVFLPLVDFAYKRGNGVANRIVRSSLIWMAKNRTADITAELNGTKRNPVHKLLRNIIEPVIYWIGKK